MIKTSCRFVWLTALLVACSNNSEKGRVVQFDTSTLIHDGKDKGELVAQCYSVHPPESWKGSYEDKSSELFSTYYFHDDAVTIGSTYAIGRVVINSENQCLAALTTAEETSLCGYSIPSYTSIDFWYTRDEIAYHFYSTYRSDLPSSIISSDNQFFLNNIVEYTYDRATMLERTARHIDAVQFSIDGQSMERRSIKHECSVSSDDIFGTFVKILTE